MQITILEVGSKSKTDMQTQIIEFDGTLQDYKDAFIKDVEEDTNLKLEDATTTDDGSNLVIDYFCFGMNKSIRHYAFVPLDFDKYKKELEEKSKSNLQE
jgi:hypothetical protein